MRNKINTDSPIRGFTHSQIRPFANSQIPLSAKKIREILDEEIRLGPDVVQFIDTTFSNPSIRELEQILRDEYDCERDSLIELLFYPDESMQARLETLLEGAGFRIEDERAILSFLLSDMPETRFELPGRGGFNFAMPGHAAEEFISRLNITKTIDRCIVETINRYFREPDGTLVKVKLRNARYVPGQEGVSFICRFLEKMNRGAGDFMKSLDLILLILEERGDGGDILRILMNKRELHLRNLKIASRFEEKLKTGNMETLMLQGTRIPFINREDSMAGIVMIEKICYCVFGEWGNSEWANGRICEWGN